MTTERRSFRRYDLSLVLTVRRADNGQTIDGHTRDISSRGIYFLVNGPFPSGCRIDLTVSLARASVGEPGSFVVARGHVIRAEPRSKVAEEPVTGVAAVIESYDIIRSEQVAS
ncbi:MAG TPA: PilZ domain-containing protein [Candidatus Acidoferrales bacterium]|nr:PilZ domain-containing protein [Candidatus Acidoferrales bacterium]